MGLSLKDRCSCARSREMSSEQKGQGMTEVLGRTPTNQSSTSNEMWSNTFESSPALIMSFFSSSTDGVFALTVAEIDFSMEEASGERCRSLFPDDGVEDASAAGAVSLCSLYVMTTT